MSQILAAGTISWVHAARDDLSLTELKGRPAIPAFYPADWSPGLRRTACALQRGVARIPQARRGALRHLGAGWCHEAFVQARRLHFPLLADFDPKGAVANSYGAYREGEGAGERALFVLDRNGVIFWS